jgi:voltage-gated potassium channel
MVGGMFTLALFAGVVGTTMLNSMMRLREEQLRMLNTIGHIVVCGYDAGSRMLLDALERETEATTDLVIFSRGERPTDIPPRFSWVPGDPTKESELDKIDLAGAATAIIVGPRTMDPQMADAQTLLTVFTARAYLSRQKSYAEREKPLHIIAEILEMENVGHAHKAGSDEVVESTRVGFSLMAHAAVAPRTSNMLTLLASRDGHSLHACDVGQLSPDIGNFAEAAVALRSTYGALAIGVRIAASGEEILNPPDDTAVTENDRITYLADKALLPSG